ncbi:MAG: nucleoside deaminase [Acidobacteria bacterium]|nr:nucleoside deaminase [Acidobacteriota bacterium]
MDHELFMRKAIELAHNSPQCPFGALLVHQETGEIVAEGWNQSEEKLDPTSHGETEAIKNCIANRRLEKADWRNLILYTTAEPCAMCAGAIYWTGIGMLVFGSSIPFLRSLGDKWYAIDIRAEELLKQGRPPWEGSVLGGILEKECNELFERAPQISNKA